MKVFYFCKGHVTEARIRHIHRWGERIIVFEDVPGEVCEQCGEVYLAPDVLEAMDQIVAGSSQPEAVITVPVSSLAGASSDVVS